MKIIQYCQHVLDIGHLFCSLEISRALSDHEVILITGGIDGKIKIAIILLKINIPSFHYSIFAANSEVPKKPLYSQ